MRETDERRGEDGAAPGGGALDVASRLTSAVSASAAPFTSNATATPPPYEPEPDALSALMPNVAVKV